MHLDTIEYFLMFIYLITSRIPIFIGMVFYEDLWNFEHLT